MEKVRLTVEGMNCDHCVRSVDSALRRVAGVREVTVGMGDAQVVYDPGEVQVDRMLEAVEEEGYVAYRAEAPDA